MFNKFLLSILLISSIILGVFININSSENEHKQGSKVLTQEIADQMIKENDGKLIQMEDDIVPNGYPYFVGYNNESHKAVYSKNKIEEENSTRSKITNIKYVGTWSYKGYWGVMISDQNNNLVYCGDFGKNEPIGSKNWTYKESSKVKRALSWGYPNVSSSTSRNDNYARTQLAIWGAQKSISVSSTTLGPYQKVADAYLNKISANEKTLTLTSIANAGVVENFNMSNTINVAGSSRYKFEDKVIDDLNKKDLSIYVYDSTNKKYIKASKNKFYSPSSFKNFRLATKQMNQIITVNNIKVLTDINPLAGYIYDNGKSSDQRIYMSFKQPVKEYSVNFKLVNQTGKIRLSKQLNKYGEYLIGSNVEFGVYKSNDDAKNNTNIVDKMVTDKNGYATSNELVAQDYFIKEVKGVNDYAISSEIIKVIVERDKTKEVDGNPNDSNSNAFINNYKYGNLIGYKSIQNIPLYDQPIKDENNNVMFLTDDFKPIIIEDNDYILKTIRYPSKNEMITNNLFNKKIVVDIPEYDYIYNEKNEIKVDSNNNLHVKLKRDVSNNIIYKKKTLDKFYPSKSEMDNIERLNGVEFSLYKNNELVQTTISKRKDNQDGIIEFNDLIPGKYIVKETKQKENTIDNNEEYLVEMKGNQTSYINNGKEIMNYYKIGELELNKKNDLKENLRSIIYAIYNRENEIVDYLISDHNGNASFRNYVGDYYIKEIVANEKHELDSRVNKFSLDNTKIKKNNYVNKIVSKYIDVSKVDFTDEQELEGAKLCLTSQDNKKFRIFVDNENKNVDEYCWISKDKPKRMKLYYGKYLIEEIIAPKNYIKTTTLIPLVINSNGVQKVKVKNQAMNITIPKTGQTPYKLYLSFSISFILLIIYVINNRSSYKDSK